MVDVRHPAVEEALYQGLHDWVQLTLIQWMVETETAAWWDGAGKPTPEDVKRESLAVVEFLLTKDLMRAGRLPEKGEPGDFIDWPGEPGEVIARIDREWDDLTARDRLEPCWLRSTSAGREAGKRVDV